MKFARDEQVGMWKEVNVADFKVGKQPKHFFGTQDKEPLVGIRNRYCKNVSQTFRRDKSFCKYSASTVTLSIIRIRFLAHETQPLLFQMVLNIISEGCISYTLIC